MSHADETTFHVHRACEGDMASVSWLIERFTPPLVATARFRLRGRLQQKVDAEDVVQDVWMRVIPRLGDLEHGDRRLTPVFLRFATTVLQRRIMELVRKFIAGKPGEEQIEPAGADGDGACRPVPKGLESTTTEVLSRLLREETKDAMLTSLERLDDRSRELIVLRGFEQLPYREIAAIVGRPERNLTMEYKRAIEKLRAELPGSLFEELEAG